MPRPTHIEIGVPAGLPERLSERKTRGRAACRLRGRDLAMAHSKIALGPYYAGFGPGQGPAARGRYLSCAWPETAGARLSWLAGSPSAGRDSGSELASTTALAAISPAATEPIDLRLAKLRQMVLDSVVSKHSKRNYAKALDDLFLFAADLSPGSADGVADGDEQLSLSTINVRLSAMRKLVTEARRNGMLGAEEAANLTAAGTCGEGNLGSATG